MTPGDDGSWLHYRLRVVDAETFTEPVELQKYWLWTRRCKLNRLSVTSGRYNRECLPGRMNMARTSLAASRLVVACLLASSIGLVSSTQAHHSRAAYDTTREVLLEGTVVDVHWRNPHIYFTFELEGDDGSRSLQEVEVGPLSTLQPRGLTRSAIVPGEHVAVLVNPNRRGPGHVVVGLELTKDNGDVFPLHVVGRSRAVPVAASATGLAGHWVSAAEEFTEIVRRSRDWPLTASALEAATAGGGDSQMECTPWPAPLLMALPMLRVIEVSELAVTMRFDWMKAVRTIRLDIGEHPRDITPSLQGHSIGRWEGETLVIDSVGFSPHPEGGGFGVPSGEGKHLIERLTLSDDQTRLSYEFTIEDPLSFTTPFTHSMQWVHRPDLAPTGEECDLEVARRSPEP